jgi:hypothetical protein
VGLKKIVPAIIEKIETILKSFRKYLRNVPGKHDIKELQKTAIFCTAQIFG